MSTFKNTAEQDQIIELARTGQNCVIEAGAGTGKTATLKLIAEALDPRRGQYIAFNKAIVVEAGGKFPATVTASTAHSLAYRAVAVGTPFVERQRQGKRMRSIDIANTLGVDPLTVTDFLGTRKQLSKSFLGSLALEAVQRFCQSADAEPTWRHVPRIEGLDHDGYNDRRRAVAKEIEPAIKLAWRDLSRHHGSLPFTKSTAMAVYLKLWQLSEPRIGADYILFDEAQDANPVMVAVVSAQTHSQLIWVGDSQQQIYGFTGAINALAKVPYEHRAFLTQSFRFGPAIAEVANQILSVIDGAELRIRGTETIPSVVQPVAEPAAILCRTNAEAVRTVLRMQQDEVKVHLVGGGADVVSFAKAARDLMNGLRTDHAELACFEGWSEVQDYVRQDEQGKDLELLVRLVDEFGVETILAALASNVKEEDAEVVVSTAHKAKGREWDSVQLAADFKAERISGENASSEEQRLLYVAVTRARRELDIDALPFLRDGLTPSTAPVVTTAAQAAGEQDGREETAQDATEPLVAVTAPEEIHYGRIGDRADLSLTVERQSEHEGPYGGYATSLVSETGHHFSWFAPEQFVVGTKISGSWKIKGHSEFRGVPETQLNYAAGVDVESVPAPVVEPEPVGVVDDGEPF